MMFALIELVSLTRYSLAGVLSLSSFLFDVRFEMYHSKSTHNMYFFILMPITGSNQGKTIGKKQICWHLFFVGWTGLSDDITLRWLTCHATSASFFAPALFTELVSLCQGEQRNKVRWCDIRRWCHRCPDIGTDIIKPVRSASQKSAALTCGVRWIWNHSFIHSRLFLRKKSFWYTVCC